MTIWGDWTQPADVQRAITTIEGGDAFHVVPSYDAYPNDTYVGAYDMAKVTTDINAFEAQYDDVTPYALGTSVESAIHAHTEVVYIPGHDISAGGLTSTPTYQLDGDFEAQSGVFTAAQLRSMADTWWANNVVAPIMPPDATTYEWEATLAVVDAVSFAGHLVQQIWYGPDSVGNTDPAWTKVFAYSGRKIASAPTNTMVFEQGGQTVDTGINFSLGTTYMDADGAFTVLPLVRRQWPDHPMDWTMPQSRYDIQTDIGQRADITDVTVTWTLTPPRIRFGYPDVPPTPWIVGQAGPTNCVFYNSTS